MGRPSEVGKYGNPYLYGKITSLINIMNINIQYITDVNKRKVWNDMMEVNDNLFHFWVEYHYHIRQGQVGVGDMT